MEALLPDGVGPWMAAGLVAASVFASAVSATASIGGGAMMLAILAMVLPPPALVPVHGMLQLGSNSSRFLFMRRHLPPVSLRLFAVATLAGSAVGGVAAVHVPPGLVIAFLSLFILWSVWGTMPGLVRRIGMGVGGLMSGAVTMFVGATGPLVGALLRHSIHDRMAFIAVHAGCMTIQHIFKLVIFGVLGFAYGPYLPLLAAMVAGGFLGSYLGRRVLMGFTDARFQTVLKVLLTLAALRILWMAAG